MAVLNARLGWTLGEPLHAVDVFLALGLRATGMASVVLIGGLPSIASLRLGELAILVTAHEWQQSVEWAIHAPIAACEGIAVETIAAIARGERPATLTDDEAAVYDVCTELHRQRSVSDATWAAAIARVGEPGVVDLIGINGYYALLATVMNAARTLA